MTTEKKARRYGFDLIEDVILKFGGTGKQELKLIKNKYWAIILTLVIPIKSPESRKRRKK